MAAQDIKYSAKLDYIHSIYHLALSQSIILENTKSLITPSERELFRFVHGQGLHPRTQN